MLGRGRDDGIDILAVEHLAIVLDGHTMVFLGGLLAAGKIDIGHGNESCEGISQRSRQVAAALPADSDTGDTDLVVRAGSPRRGQDAGRNQVGRRDSCRSQGRPMQEELAS